MKNKEVYLVSNNDYILITEKERDKREGRTKCDTKNTSRTSRNALVGLSTVT